MLRSAPSESGGRRKRDKEKAMRSRPETGNGRMPFGHNAVRAITKVKRIIPTVTPAPRYGATVTADNIVGGVIAVALIVYLLVALLFPERF